MAHKRLVCHDKTLNQQILHCSLRLAPRWCMNHLTSSEVSLTQGHPVYFRWTWYCIIGLLSTSQVRFRAFPCCTLVGKAKERLVLQSNSANDKLLTPAAMVDNPAEKVNECSLKLGSSSIVSVQLGQRKLSVIQSSGVSTVQGLLLKYWSQWKDSWDFRNCPLSRVPLYTLFSQCYTDKARYNLYIKSQWIVSKAREPPVAI